MKSRRVCKLVSVFLSYLQGLGRVRRRNYVFVWYIGDHEPPPLHVFKYRRLIIKWDVLNNRPLEGAFESLERLRDEDQ